MKRGLMVLGSVVLASGCATMRTFQLPLSPAEGQMVVPALIAAGQQQGLQAYRGVSGAVVDLEDGTRLSWQESANHRDFILVVQLPEETPEPDYEQRFQKAKARADQLWAAAVDARRASGVVPVLVMPGVAAPPRDCRLGSDGFEACGYGCMVGSNGRAACAPTPDGSCHLNSNGTINCGRNCRFTSSGYHACD
jgi:hypothetical protein